MLQSIVSRVQALPDLPLSRTLADSDITIEEHLSDLVAREPGIFLERYGHLLLLEELDEFAQLKGSSYEVSHYVDLWRARKAQAAGGATGRARTLVKNRRLAKMQLLELEGLYFSLAAMRERAPLLFEESGVSIAGAREEAPGGPPAAGGSHGLSEMLLSACQERQLQSRLLAEKRQEEALPEEEEDTTDEEEGGALAGDGIGAEDGNASASAGQADQSRREAAFTRTMKERFLDGKDVEYADYAQIDGDFTLDECWAKEQTADAQEKYFDAD